MKATYGWDPWYGEPFRGHVLEWEQHEWDTQSDREFREFEWVIQDAHLYQWADKRDKDLCFM